MYDPTQQLFVGWGGSGDRTAVFTLNPDNWRWTRFGAASSNSVTPTAAPNAGTNGRFRYIPEFNAFILVNATDENVYLYKMSTGSGTPIDPPPSVTLTATPDTVSAGETTQLTWSTTNANSCSASGGWDGAQSTDNQAGLTSEPLTQNTTFTLSCNGPGGGANASATVTVQGGEVPDPAVELTASSARISGGDAVTLTWAASNAALCQASSTDNGPWFGRRDESGGNQLITNIEQDTSYTLNCVNSAGVRAIASQNVTVDGTINPPSVTLTAASNTVVTGTALTLDWDSNNTTSCVASGDWSGRVALSGSQTFPNITGSQSYLLTCTGDSGGSSDLFKITVTDAPATQPTPLSQSSDRDGGGGGGGVTSPWLLLMLCAGARRRRRRLHR